MCCGAITNITAASAGGKPARIQPVIRPCAVSTRTCRFTLNRSRITVARLSSTSPRLPPVSRCVSTAVAKNRASSSGMRAANAVQRIRQRHPEVLLVVEQLELGANRRRHLLGRHQHARC